VTTLPIHSASPITSTRSVHEFPRDTITVNASGMLNLASGILEHHRSETGQADGALPSDPVEPQHLLSALLLL